jgi:hypothetical protein
MTAPHPSDFIDGRQSVPGPASPIPRGIRQQVGSASRGRPDRKTAATFDAERSMSPSPPPRVEVKGIGAGYAIEPAPDEAENLDGFRTGFLAAFGTADDVVAEALFGQLLNVLQTEPGKPVDSAIANLALALMHEIGPKDVVEAMLACQMIAGHVAAMDASRRALHVEQTAAGRAAYLSLSRKLMTLFTAQMDALNRHRGKGTTQKIVIERVYVAPGAQAVVGAVASERRGDGG